MNCPYCGFEDSKVIDSRPSEEKIRRRRECLECSKRFTTYEVIERLPLMVIKRDQTRQPFNRDKLMEGLLRATKKRPISIDTLEKIIDEMKEEKGVHYDTELTADDLKELANKFKAVYKEAMAYCPTMYGLHLEGPYISPNQKGAHKEKYLRTPSRKDADILLQTGAGIIKRITAAPELPGMKEFAEIMLQNGVSLCLGHSDATSDIAMDAFEYGFSHVTHLYSATPSVRKINQVVKAGVVEAAYLHDTVTVELIADGKHAAQDALKLAVKIKGTDKVALVSDALRPAGTEVCESYLGEKIPENRVIIEDGVAKLPDRSSFAGSIATSSMLLEKGINHYGFSIGDTVEMLTKTPANILGLKDKGRLEEGCIADIVLFDAKYQVKEVLLQGKRQRI